MVIFIQRYPPLATAQEFLITIGNMAATDTPGTRFRTFRTQVGLTGQALAERLGVSKTAVSYWESGRVSLSQTACLLAEQLFNISSTWLLEGIDPMWCTVPSQSLPGTPDLLLRPLLSDDAFLPDGSFLPPRDTASCLGLPRTTVAVILDVLGGGSSEDLYFFRTAENELKPTLFPGDWVLVHTSTFARQAIENHMLYLVRVRPQDPLQLRRLALDPLSGDLLLGVDLPNHVPLRMILPVDTRPRVVLGRVCWIGGRR